MLRLDIQSGQFLIELPMEIEREKGTYVQQKKKKKNKRKKQKERTMQYELVYEISDCYFEHVMVSPIRLIRIKYQSAYTLYYIVN